MVARTECGRLTQIVGLQELSFGVVVCSGTSTKADSVTFTLGNNPQQDEKNILLNSGTSGNPVFGLTNQTQLQVRFGSTTDTLVEPSSGQARVEALDGF